MADGTRIPRDEVPRRNAAPGSIGEVHVPSYRQHPPGCDLGDIGRLLWRHQQRSLDLPGCLPLLRSSFQPPQLHNLYRLLRNPGGFKGTAF